MLSAEDKARVKWACRRGMLELDVIIMPFFEECFDALPLEEPLVLPLLPFTESLYQNMGCGVALDIFNTARLLGS